MSDIELRRAVAEALGCKVFPSKGALTCGCDLVSHCAKDTFELKPYETDNHDALDALREFCEKNECRWEIADLNNTAILPCEDRYRCQIEKEGYCCTAYHAHLAMAICFCIKKAAESAGMRE